jgi:hypothetical protein
MNELQTQAYDKHGEIDPYKYAELIVQHSMAITRMCSLRNGSDSSENKMLEKVRKELTKYFGIEEKNVNEIFDNDEVFREYYGLPKKGDRTWVE